MKVVPVLDVRGSQAVLAVAGDRRAYRPVRSVLTPGADPVDLARAMRDVLEVDTVYVALLDAIEGGSFETDQIRALAATGLRLWVDAGIRTAEEARRLRDLGVQRVIVATETFPGVDTLRAIVDALGSGRLILSLDLLDGAPFVSAAEASPQGLVGGAYQSGVRDILLLSLTHTGTRRGSADWAVPIRETLRAVAPGARWMAGGGCADSDDLQRLEAEGFDAVLVGRAIHEGVLDRQTLKRWR